MKTLNRLLKEILLLQRFQIHALMIFLMFSMSSCFQKYYKTNTATTADSATLHKLIAENKSFILHTPEGPYAVKNPAVDQDLFTGEKQVLNPGNDQYLNPSATDPNRLHMKQSGTVLNEVHLYSKQSMDGDTKINLNLNQIYRMDVYGFDKKATKDSRILGIVGITVGTGAIVGLAVMAATSFDNEMHNMQFSFH